MSAPTIIFQNTRLILVDKPALVLTTPSRDAADPRRCLGRELQAHLGTQIFPVHRLDFEVSGLVMFALDRDAHRIAQAWFETGRVARTYRAITAAGTREPPCAWTEWTSRLVRGKRRTFRADHGKPSRTRARAIDAAADRLTWDLMPLTGRPHQLRFEVSDRGWPILGDVLYGGPPRAGGIALRAWSLDFGEVGDALGLPPTLTVPAET